MQAVERQSLILYQTHLHGQWPEEGGRALTVRLPYLKRLALGRDGEATRASLAGIALALQALSELLGRRVTAGELVFARGEKPRLMQRVQLAVVGGAVAAGRPLAARGSDIAADFSISHSGPWVACAAIAGARLGLDIEAGTGPLVTQWVVREALLKATGVGLRAAGEARSSALPQVGRQEVCLRWRDESWYARRLDLFPGASACVLSSCPVGRVVVRSVPLAELFAP